MPWVKPTQPCGLKGRESWAAPPRHRVLATLQAALDLLLFPGHRPSASALGSVLPARWAGVSVCCGNEIGSHGLYESAQLPRLGANISVVSCGAPRRRLRYRLESLDR